MHTKLLSTVVNTVNMGIIVVDTNAKILLWNQWITNHTGISEHDVIGRDLTTAFNEPVSPALIKAINNTLSYGLPTVLSNALHKSPLPLYSQLNNKNEHTLMLQSITVSYLAYQNNKTACMIQVIDASTSLKREKMLRSHSESLKREAITDSLTGIYNRRFFDDHFKLSIHNAIRHKQCMSVFLIDIDYFKQYNDNYGHLLGDKTLKAVALALKQQLARASDMIARYGGEEFVMIFPNFCYEQSVHFTERLIKAVYDLAIPHDLAPPHYRVTISIGTCSGLPSQNEDILDLADAALYEAKQQGRNRSVCKNLDETSTLCQN